MKILITGATGFIGKHLVQGLQHKHELLLISKNGSKEAYKCDLRDIKKTHLIVKSFNPDCVIHLAANPLTKLNEENPNAILYDNVIATQNLCHYLEPGCRFIFASSVIVYGNLPNAKESDVCNPISVYGASKLASEAILSAYQETHGILPVSLRLCATVGKNTTHGILKDFIRKLSEPGEFFEALGSEPGSNKPFLHVDDACAVIERMIHNNWCGPLNVVPDGTLTVKEIAELVLSLSNCNTKTIKWLGEKSTWSGDNKLILCKNDLLKTMYIPAHDSVSAMVMAIKESL